MINPLTVADNGNKLRLILDCRYINRHLQIPKFKCEDIRTIRDLFQKMIIFSNVTLSRVIIILIFLNPTKNIWVLLGKLTASRGFLFSLCWCLV